MEPPPFSDGNGSLWLASVMDSCKSALFHKNRLQDKWSRQCGSTRICRALTGKLREVQHAYFTT